MNRVFKGFVLILAGAAAVIAQISGGYAPDAVFQDVVKPKMQVNLTYPDNSSKAQTGFIYSTTTYTFADLIIFSYFANSKFYAIDANGMTIDSITLDQNEYHIFSPGTGVFSIEGNQSFTLLIGDPISNSVMGYFAVDESGNPLSTRLNTYMPASSYAGEHFIVFGYNDGTGFQIKDLSANSTIAAGILNEGEHFQLDGYSAKFLGVYSDKPVSALSYTDQGYYIPASNGTFAGKEFYGFSGYISYWGNGIIVTSYEDSTDFVALNSITGDTLFMGRLDKGMVSSYSVYSDLYWEVKSTGLVTVCNTPYASFSGNYYYLTRQIDESGRGIGTNFFTPVIPGNVNIFSYEDDNKLLIHNLTADDTTWSGTLNAGEGYSFYSSKAIYHVMSQENVAVISSWGGGYGADFMPLNFATGLPDLAVSSKDISFDPEKESYGNGDAVTIYANIHNYGYENADNVRVKFYDGHPSGGVAISQLLNMGTIEAGGSVMASTTWTVPEYAEYHDLYVAVDWNGEIIESNNSNNVAYRPIIPNDDLLPPLTTTVDAPVAVDFESDTLEFDELSIRVNVFNSGTVDAENVNVNLSLPIFMSCTVPADTAQSLGNVSPNTTVSFTWNVSINQITEDDAYFYSIKVNADNAENKIIEKMLTVKRPTALENTRHENKLPTENALLSNYPNPFNPKTTIVYELNDQSFVNLSIFDILGRKITTLVSSNMMAGQHKIVWNATEYPSGIYYYKLSTDNGFSSVRKLVLMK